MREGRRRRKPRRKEKEGLAQTGIFPTALGSMPGFFELDPHL